MKSFISVCLVAISLSIIAPAQVHAFGLGKIELSSFLNEPLRAEIPVFALSEGDIKNLQITLASNEEFERAGLERSYLMTQLIFEVIQVNNQVKILIKSEQSIREPFLGFLISATTGGGGRLIREYALLLDPPKNLFVRAEPSVETEPVLIEIAPTANIDEIPATSSIEDRLVEVQPERDNYRVIAKGDTLWEIALETRPDRSVSPQQMMMALLQKNPGAFLNDNINGLRIAARLSVPDSDAINQLSKQQAIAAVAEQNDLWQNRGSKQTLAETDDFADSEFLLTPTEGLDQGEQQSDMLQEVTTEDDGPRLTLEMPDDVLVQDGELEEGDLSLMGDSDVSTLSEQLTLSQQTIEGQVQENIDLKAQMEAMEEQIQTLNRAISLKDNDLARMQAVLEEQGIEEIDGMDTADDSGQNQLAGGITSFLAENKVTVLSIGLLLIMVLWLALRRLGSSGGDDHSMSTFEDNIGEHGVRSLAVADNYIDKDDLTSAKRVLEEAHVKYPSDMQVLRKLFFVLYSQQQVKRFVSLARQIDLDEESPLWSDVSEWGRNLVPDNPLFGVGQPENASQQADIVDVVEEQVNDDPSLQDNLSEDATDDTETYQANVLALGTDNDQPEKASQGSDTVDIAPNDDDDDILAFEPSPLADNNDAQELSQVDVENADGIAPNDDDDDILAFEPSPLADNNDAQQAPASNDTDDSSDEDSANKSDDAELTMASIDDEQVDTIDENETKLDLAKAYIDIGDTDGARVILEEVVKEGNDEQKASAQSLLDLLS